MNQQLEAELIKHDHWNRRLLCAIFMCFGVPESYLDVGCGTGAMVDFASMMGIDAWGLDIIYSQSRRVIQHDLREKFNLHKNFDLVTCIEVLEHIESGYDGNVLESIANHTIPGSILVFSAAGPGQGGIEHVNLKLGSIWRTRLYDLGFSYRHDYTTKLQLAANLIPAPSRDLWIGNMQVFDK